AARCRARHGDPRERDAGEPARAPRRAAPRLRLARPGTGARERRHGDRAARRPLRRSRAARRRPVGRQPAEGRAVEVARARLPRAAARRADARRRRRGEGRDLPADDRAGRLRARGALRLERAGRDPRARRPDPRAARRPPRRRAAGRAGDGGGGDGARDRRGRRRHGRRTALIDKKLLGIVAVVAVVVGLTWLQSPNFLSGGNLETLLYRTSLFGIISIGAAFVIVTGGIDLSIGSTICLVGLSLPYLVVELGWPTPLALALAALLAVAIGLFHGLLVTKLDLQPFVVTLCGLLLYRGIARWVTGDQSLGFGGEHDALTAVANWRLPL